MKSTFMKCAVTMLLVAALIAAIPAASLAAGAGGGGASGGTGTAGGTGHSTAGDRGAGAGTTAGGEIRDGGARGGAGTAHGGEVGERRVDERRAGDRGFVGGPAGGVVVYSLTVYNGDQAACYNACVASGRYQPDQCQYMCTQW